MASFDVLTEPWIPAGDLAGDVQEYGILDLLGRADQLAGIVDPAPPVQFGLYRLLIAFIMDALALTELEQVRDLLQVGHFDLVGLERYVERVGRGRFDLFHPSTPFLQSPPTAGDEAKTEAVAILLQHLPSGSLTTHFHHVQSQDQAMSPAVCARGLATIAPFMTAGGRGRSPSINGIPPWYVLVQGENLFETLVLNCFVERDLGLDGDSGPAWRAEGEAIYGKEADCSSLPEGLTWRARHVRLLPGHGGTCTYSGKPSDMLVHQVIFAAGLMFRGQETWTDPQVAYKETAKGRLPMRPDEDRELWRDTGPLLLLRKADYETENGKVRFSRPLVVEQFRRLRGEKPLQVEVCGMRTSNMKIFEWQREGLSLPAGVLQHPDAGRQVQRVLEWAEGVAYRIGIALTKAYPREGGGNAKALGRTIESAQRLFWATLEPHFRGVFLPALAAQDLDDADAPAALAETWKEALRETGGRALDTALDPLDAEAEALRRQVLARQYFHNSMAILLAPPGDGPKVRRRKGGRSVV